MNYLNPKHVMNMHQKIFDTTGGMPGLRDMGALESAIYNAFSTFDGKELYPAVADKAATMCFSIISNHPFFDGNKRTGILVMLVFLELNDSFISFSQEELISLGMGIASGRLKNNDIVDWIHSHLNVT